MKWDKLKPTEFFSFYNKLKTSILFPVAVVTDIIVAAVSSSFPFSSILNEIF